MDEKAPMTIKENTEKYLGVYYSTKYGIDGGTVFILYSWRRAVRVYKACLGRNM